MAAGTSQKEGERRIANLKVHKKLRVEIPGNNKFQISKIKFSSLKI